MRSEWAGDVWRAEGLFIGYRKQVNKEKTKRQRWYDTVKKSKKKISVLLDMGAALYREKWKSILEAAMDRYKPKKKKKQLWNFFFFLLFRRYSYFFSQYIMVSIRF